MVASCLQSLAILTLVFATTTASADDLFSCAPGARLFSTSGVRGVTESLRKLSRGEFRQTPLSPAAGSNLLAGTELNVLVDQSCLFDSNRGVHRLAWLSKLKAKLNPAAQGMHSFVWTLERDWDFSTLQHAFELESCVSLVSPNASFEMMEVPVSDPLISHQDHLPWLHYFDVLPDLLEPMLVRKRVTIAVIDSGVDFKHPDLAFNAWINRGEIAENEIDDDGNGYIDDVNGYNFESEIGDSSPQGELPESRHGTHVAGLAAARFDNGVGGIGINGVAKIMSLNIFGSTNATRSALLENAIRYAADNGADIINMSLGGREYSRTMRAALDYAISKNVFIVTAAGNYGFELCDDPESFGFVSPAVYANAIDGMMVTGSVDAADGKMSSFSNFSKRLVEIAAPGAFRSDTKLGLLSTFPGGNYAYLAGTSMAAPVVSGAASLVIAWLRTYGYMVTPQIVEQILRDSARRDPNLTDFVQEGRTLDLATLVDYLKQNYPR